MNFQDAASLPLEAPHMPEAPSFWPPAPGWWLLAAAMILLVAIICAAFWRRRKRAKLRSVAGALFDDAVANAADGAQRIAVMSELLRRAARRIDPDADRLNGEDWLGFLDRGDPATPFTAGPGRLLLDGAYRRDVSVEQATVLSNIARKRFIDWMMHGSKLTGRTQPR